jgi:pimeloyl-ACP methyl ester carboxylesterase
MNWDFIYRGETKSLDDSTRGMAGGSFIRLADGCTHYEVAGPETGHAVVLVHGFSVPYFIWDGTFQALTTAGQRVLRYDLFGRGYSDRPHVDYDLDLFVRQLAALLDALGIGKVDLVGLSMGGAIAAAFTVQFPGRVQHLALIDPIGTEPMPLNLFYKAALIPGISELILSLVGTEKMIQSLASDFYDPAQVERFRAQYRVQMQFRGFKRAIVSTLRNKTVDGSPVIYERLGLLSMPVLMLWGRQDRTLPLEQSAGIMQRVPRIDFRVIEGSGHIPNCEKPEIVHPMLLEFLNAI